TAGALVARELAKPRPNEQARLVDWDVVRRRAIGRSGEKGPTHLVFDAADLGLRYDAALAELRPWMSEALGEDLPATPFPTFTVLDRRGWIDVNLGLFQDLLEPVLKLQELLPASYATDLGRRGVSEYLGVLLGFLSKRVLGQYDPVLMAAPGVAKPTALYLVEPNIEKWERKTNIPAEQVRQWLVLHEVTHAWEFEGHPWLREHMNDMIRELIAHRLFSGDSPGRFEVLRAMTIGAREQWQAMQQIQATMSLLEGFSNVMMRRVGRAHLPNFDRVDAEFNQRSANRSAAERAFFKLTGMDMKMQQYVQGEAFCDAVMKQGGMQRLSAVWESADRLPTLAEIRNPELWLNRVH
ncbi:MAG TPA: zinc-dependent metalloprotease, partial [Candidatus Dormibacteraeota bacterium]|nr:zinc-dependent metalloprotease [Candidatus Dormibacteraeota bacterium]